MCDPKLYCAGVVELVDTPASGAGALTGVEVQVFSPVPIHNKVSFKFAVQVWWNW